MKGILDSKVALVTGASSGIGRETAIRLAENGCQVIAAARRLDRLNGLAQDFEGIVPKQVDLSVPEEVESFCRYLGDQTEPVTILVNNAGYSVQGVLEDISMTEIRRLYEVNVFSLVRITQACLPGMRGQRKGIIINVSSMSGKVPNPLNSVYSSTKNAVEALSDTLRLDLRPFGINVVTIRPGPIATELMHDVAEQWNKLTGKGVQDYTPLYKAAGEGIRRMMANITLPGPEKVADVILEAVMSDEPKAAYGAGPMVDELLAQRATLSDDQFDRFIAESTGLANLKI